MVDRDPDAFVNRKGFYSLNAMVVGGYDKIIYDVIANVPGAMHDATAYRLSEFKAYLESRYPREICVGDKAYPISDVMIKPYPRDEAENDSRKALFNMRLCGARMKMTENIYSMYKEYFPIFIYIIEKYRIKNNKRRKNERKILRNNESYEILFLGVILLSFMPCY